MPLIIYVCVYCVSRIAFMGSILIHKNVYSEKFKNSKIIIQKMESDNAYKFEFSKRRKIKRKIYIFKTNIKTKNKKCYSTTHLAMKSET